MAKTVPSVASSLHRPSIASCRVAPVLFLALALALAPFAAAQEPAEEAPAMSPEMAAEMAAWEKAMTPGPQHERLAAMAGDWEAEMKMWMEPGAEPMTTSFTATRRMTFDGRFLEEEVEGDVMGRPFRGRAVTGYDNVTGTWWSTWVDNLATGLTVGEGSWDEASSSFTFDLVGADPATGEENRMKSVIRVLSADHEVHEMWDEHDGESFKSMEFVYRRK